MGSSLMFLLSADCENRFGNGRTRVLFQLQQPQSESLFILGAGSLALPTDGVLNAEAPVFVVREMQQRFQGSRTSG